MAVVIGTDEAGYGPNLGPLLVSATVWRVPHDALRDCLYERLQSDVCAQLANRGDTRIQIADSKQLYKPGGGLAGLERGLLPALAVSGHHPCDWSSVWKCLAPGALPWLETIPWYCGYRADTPRDAEAGDVQARGDRLQRALHAADVQLTALRSRAVFPEEFNQLVEQHGSKGAALSQITLGLARDALADVGDEAVLIQCDKHGGRNRYAALLQQLFPEYLVEVRGEGRAESVYRWGPPRRRIEIRFTAKGEQFLPAALASMACKYLRELAMEAFNAYWGRRVENLRPTAGYPADARRFRADIEPEQKKLGIHDRVLWRCR